ncbi:TraB/GumN family protein [Marivita sp. GX14005]|uniref:TraB/GumN family protein n=1 Tax=Marivita sp. GX14005 TaxID=2942276 RepID=UPI002018E307|nr:TraB/GumN family protein [Marivita sp. GX14005]MCL3881272.1 TraB/GumN family protein [Marivita sp. GX14005]
MPLRLLALVLSLAFGQTAIAACSGTDLRTTLSADEQERIDDAVAEAPYASGNHWRATRDDAVLHLIGTMHLADPRLSDPLERLRPVIESADLLLLEMPQKDEDALQERLSSEPGLLLMQDTSLPELLDEDQWAQMSDALSARGVPPFMGSRFQPWYVSVLLAIPPCAASPDLAEGGLDARIEDIAQDAGVPRAALEDAETIFAAFADQPREMQVEMMLSALVEPQVSEDLFATLLASYFDERPAEGWAVSAVLAERYSPIEPDLARAIFATLEQELLIDRNRAWIPVLTEAADRHDTVVAAFGAAHLPGETGVLALLEAEGFTLERLPF